MTGATPGAPPPPHPKARVVPYLLHGWATYRAQCVRCGILTTVFWPGHAQEVAAAHDREWPT